jgi:hypothetical protein
MGVVDMKHMKTVHIFAHDEQVFDKLTCDVCGAESNGDENWAANEFEHTTSTLNLEERVSHPDGGHSSDITFHLCPACFKSKLVPWLKSQGAQPTIGSADW